MLLLLFCCVILYGLAGGTGGAGGGLSGPYIVSVEPAMCPLAGTRIVITGENFVPDTSVVIAGKQYVLTCSFPTLLLLEYH